MRRWECFTAGSACGKACAAELPVLASADVSLSETLRRRAAELASLCRFDEAEAATRAFVGDTAGRPAKIFSSTPTSTRRAYYLRFFNTYLVPFISSRNAPPLPFRACVGLPEAAADRGHAALRRGYGHDTFAAGPNDTEAQPIP